ncbi:MAG: hypothetical protein J7J42_05380 [Thermoplasmata archaeon]|nr:hypothetical protein [Thermoplasmata archaeon]
MEVLFLLGIGIGLLALTEIITAIIIFGRYMHTHSYNKKYVHLRRVGFGSMKICLGTISLFYALISLSGSGPYLHITADAHSVSSIMFFSVLGGTTLLNGILSIIPKSLPKPISMLKGLYLPIALMGLFVGFGGGI